MNIKNSRIQNLVIFVAVSIALFYVFSEKKTYKETYAVKYIVDGDTIDINYHGKIERVRLLCVDTPESVHPNQKYNTPLGKTASKYTKNRLSGKYVGIELEEKKRGKYGRLLAYVFVDNKNFNIELVKKGLSPYYTKYGKSKKYDKQFCIAEATAKQLKLNIWNVQSGQKLNQ